MHLTCPVKVILICPGPIPQVPFAGPDGPAQSRNVTNCAQGTTAIRNTQRTIAKLRNPLRSARITKAYVSSCAAFSLAARLRFAPSLAGLRLSLRSCLGVVVVGVGPAAGPPPLRSFGGCSGPIPLGGSPGSLSRGAGPCASLSSLSAGAVGWLLPSSVTSRPTLL